MYMGKMEVLAPDIIDKFLASILFNFYPLESIYSQSSQVETKLSLLLNSFPLDSIPKGMTQNEAVIEFFKKYKLIVIGSHEFDKVLIRGNYYSGLRMESRIV